MCKRLKFGQNNMESVRRINKDEVSGNSGKIIAKEGLRLFPDSDKESYTDIQNRSYQVSFH
jgi:hypothetical protein